MLPLKTVFLKCPKVLIEFLGQKEVKKKYLYTYIYIYIKHMFYMSGKTKTNKHVFL